MWWLAVGVICGLILVYMYDDTLRIVAPDGITYGVVPGVSTAQSAETLAFINAFLIDVMRHLREKYIFREGGDKSFSYPTDDTPREFVERLVRYYDPEVIREHIPRGTTNTSYVINKGSEVVFCLKSSGSFEDRSTLQFVALHELTHIGTLSYGHEADFWENFKFMLKEAQEAGLYQPINYAAQPATYCGLHLDYNPLFG